MFTRKRLIFCTVLCVVLYSAAVTTTRASTFTIATTPPNVNISTFGYPNTATYGQTITAVAGTTQLNSFSFYIQTSGTITYRAYVMAWDGTKATGPILFQSLDQVTSGTGLNQYTYNTGGISLTPGSQYVLFASVSNNYFVGNSAGVMGARNNNPYSGGRFVYSNNGNNFGQLLSNNWDTFGDSYDLAFTAQLSSPNEVPEPTTMALFGTGLVGIAAQLRRRRKAQSNNGTNHEEKKR